MLQASAYVGKRGSISSVKGAANESYVDKETA